MFFTFGLSSIQTSTVADLFCRILRSYDTYFFNDPSRLSDYFTRQNESTLGQLIISFFAYFADTFDYQNDVISMRSKNLTKSDKGWTEDGERDHVYLCIEVGGRFYCVYKASKEADGGFEPF
jgi:DNA polymerase sigma